MGDLPMTTDVTEVKCVYTVLMVSFAVLLFTITQPSGTGLVRTTLLLGKPLTVQRLIALRLDSDVLETEPHRGCG